MFNVALGWVPLAMSNRQIHNGKCVLLAQYEGDSLHPVCMERLYPYPKRGKAELIIGEWLLSSLQSSGVVFIDFKGNIQLQGGGSSRFQWASRPP